MKPRGFSPHDLVPWWLSVAASHYLGRLRGARCIIRAFGPPKKYKILGTCTLTSSCNNVFYCLEKEEVNPYEAKVMKAFTDFYGYMWRYIWHFPFLKGFFFFFLNGSNGLPLSPSHVHSYCCHRQCASFSKPFTPPSEEQKINTGWPLCSWEKKLFFTSGDERGMCYPLIFHDLFPWWLFPSDLIRSPDRQCANAKHLATQIESGQPRKDFWIRLLKHHQKLRLLFTLILFLFLVGVGESTQQTQDGNMATQNPTAPPPPSLIPLQASNPRMLSRVKGKYLLLRLAAVSGRKRYKWRSY